MTTAPIFEARKAKLRQEAKEMAESIINGYCNHVVDEITNGRRSVMARAALVGRVILCLQASSFITDGYVADFINAIERRAVGEV